MIRRFEGRETFGCVCEGHIFYPPYFLFYINIEKIITSQIDLSKNSQLNFFIILLPHNLEVKHYFTLYFFLFYNFNMKEKSLLPMCVSTQTNLSLYDYLALFWCCRILFSFTRSSAYRSSFHESGTPGRHQWLQSWNFKDAIFSSSDVCFFRCFR